MPSLKIKRDQFGSSAQLYGPNGLGAVIRALAIDNALTRIQIAAIADLVDNTTGTAGASIANSVVQAAPFDATVAGGAQLAAFNAAVGKFENAGKVLVNSVQDARARLGLVTLTAASGTEATPDTLPAQDKTITTTNGATSTDFVVGRARIVLMRQNTQRLIWAVNEVFVACGFTPLVYALASDVNPSTAAGLVAIPAATAHATGASAISKASADAFFTVQANTLAHIAAKWNANMTQTAPTAVNVIAG